MRPSLLATLAQDVEDSTPEELVTIARQLAPLGVQLNALIADARALIENATAHRWLDSAEAAEFLGIGRDRLTKLARQGVIPSEQERPGCKRYFRRSDLDGWREGRRVAERAA